MRSLAAALALLVLLLAGCTAGGTTSDAAGLAASDGGGVEVGAEQSAADAVGGGTDDSASVGEGAEADVATAVGEAARQVITEGTVFLTVDEPRAAVHDAAALVEQAGGHVQERVEQAADDDSPAYARLVVRVPSAGLTPVLAELERLGTVEDVELRSTDVTGQAQDLDARIRALQISVARLEDLLSRAESTADLVAAESSLTERQTQLEQLQSQRARLADRVEMSTLALELRAEDEAPALEPAGFWGGLVTGWESLVAALSAALVVTGVLLPWALVLGAVALGAVTVRRYVRRRRTDGRSAGPTSAAAAP